MDKDKRIFTLSEEKPSKAVLKMGLPLIAGMFVMVLYNLVDTFFIGLMDDPLQLAAVNLAYPVMMISIALSNMVGTGAGSLIARSIGADDMDTANHTATVGFSLTVVNSLIVTIVGLILINPIVNGLGAKADTFDYTKQYIVVILIGTIFTMGNFTFGQLLRSEGSVKYSVAGMLLGTVANIILDPLFIFVFGMEIRGAAIATIIGNAFGMLTTIFFYMTGKTILKPKAKYILPTGYILGEIFWVGIPATLETLLTSVAYIINNNLASAYGSLYVAATGIAQKIMTIGTYIYQGMASGVQPLMGYNYGAKNYKRMLKILKSGVLITSGIELCVMAVFGIAAPWLIDIFTNSAEVITIGAKVLRAIMFILPFVGAISMSRITFQSMGKPLFAFAITLVRQLFLYVPLLIILNMIFKFDGMIWAQPITECIMMIASVSMLTAVLKHLDKNEATQS